MRSLFGAGALALVLAFAMGARGLAAAEKYDIDPVHSFPCFTVGHMNIGHVHGCFSDSSGTVMIDKKNLEKSSIEVTIKTVSVNTNVAKRDDDLRSANFFDVEKFPTMTFKSTKVKKVSKNKLKVTGDFTLLGVTKKITVTVDLSGEGDDPWGGHRFGFVSMFSIKRSDYGMAKMIPGAADKVDIMLLIECVKKKEGAPEKM